jgi:hypothetical protein
VLVVQTRDHNGNVLEAKFEWREVQQVTWDGEPVNRGRVES